MVDVPVSAKSGSKIMKTLRCIYKIECNYPAQSGYCYLRKMPLVLPENLFPWILKHKPQVLPSADAVSSYWRHMSQRNLPWVAQVLETGRYPIPIYLWGDDAVYNERNEKIVAVVCGSWMDDRKDSKDTVFPLFTYRAETRLH